MSTSQQQRRHALKVLALTAALWGQHLTVLAQAPSKTTAQEPALLRIGYQKSAVNLVVLKQQGVLEKRLPHTRVQWLEFPAGPQLLEALAVGSLELGFTGDAPPVFAQAAGKPLLYVGAEPPKPQSSAILVHSDGPLQSLKDLKGKKIALQKGSSAHYLLVRALDQAGLRWHEVQTIYLAPSDARAAFERRSVDAWVIWDPFYAATELSVKPRVLSNGVGLSGNNSFYLASVAFTQQHGAVIKTVLDELGKADQFVNEQRPAAIKLIADFSGLDAGVVSLFLSRRPRSAPSAVRPETLVEQQRVADAFFQLGLIPQPIKVSDIVWR